MSHDKHKIALIGFGTVAHGLIEILHDRRNQLYENKDFNFDIVAVATRSRGTMYHPDGLPLDELLSLGKSSDPFTKHLKEWSVETMIRESNATIIIELSHTDLETAEPALTYCRTALETGKHVVSGNKGPAAISYHELVTIASKHGKLYLNEATVLSGTPVFSLARSALAGVKIKRIRGILNGATNFILSEMEAGTPYSVAMGDAEKLGYLEADHTADIEAYDAQAKLVILANILMSVPLRLKDVERSGISHLDFQEIQSARDKGERWKLVATIDVLEGSVQAKVKAERLSLKDPLAHVMGTTNAIILSTDLLGDISISGPGAGSVETGYAILSDLLTINSEVSS